MKYPFISDQGIEFWIQAEGDWLAGTHASSRRARDRWPDEAPTRPRSTLTTVRVTRQNSQREDEPHPGGIGRRRRSRPEGLASLFHRSENDGAC